MALIEFTSGTPKYWKQYLDYLEAQYKQDLVDWQIESVRLMDEYEARPWYLKILTSRDDIDMHNQWVKPEKRDRKYEPTVVDYYNWDVNIRGKELPKVVK